MTKKEILQELAKAQLVYAAAIEQCEQQTSFNLILSYLVDKNLEKGFCTLFYEKYSSEVFHILLSELEKDLLKEVPPTHFWYETVIPHFPSELVIKNKDTCLQPRYDHLERTITRLQDEIRIIGKKEEIIQVLERAKVDYEEAINAEINYRDDDFFSQYLFYLMTKQVASGFCYYFNTWQYVDDGLLDAALSELNADAKRVDGLLTWYHVATDLSKNQDKINLALQPRLNNINRTIIRLQAEINSINQ